MDVVEKALAGGHWPWVTLVQVTLIATLGVLAWVVARRAGPALRGVVVLAALVGLLAVPALATVAPIWLPLSALAHDDPVPEPPEPRTVGWVPRVPQIDVPVTPALTVPEPTVNLPPGMAEEPIDPFEELLLAEMMAEQAAAAPPLPQVQAVPPAVELVKPRRAAPSVVSILVTVWLVGVVFCLVRSLVCLAVLYRSAWGARPIPEAEWTACLGPADREARPRVSVRESRAVGSPLTLGLFRPVILLPRGWRDWSVEQLRLVLAHEMAHVRRRDFLAGLVAELAVCVCWFHPVVRWLASRLRLEQEYAADARAASVAGDAMTYVRCLARLALEQGTGRRALAPALWRRRPEILRRIDMLRRNRDGLSRRVGWGAAIAVVVLAGAACVAVAGVGPLRVIPGVPEIFDATPADDSAPEEVKVAAGAARDAHGDPLPAGATARLGTTRWRQGANITYLAYGADDKTLITAGQDGTVRLWDLTTGQEIRRFARPAPAGRPAPQPVRPPGAPGGAGAAPAPVPQPAVVQRATVEAQAAAEKARAEAAEARTALSAAKARLDNAKPGAEADEAKRKLEAAKAAEQAARAKVEAARARLEAQLRQRQLGGVASTTPVVAVSADGKTIAVAGGDVVQLYEVQTGKELRKIQGITVGLVALLFSPDGKTLAGRGSDSGVTLWETDTAKELQKIKAPVQHFDRANQVVAIRAGGNDTPGITFTPDSKSVIVVTTEVKDQSVASTVKFWSVATGEEVRDLKGPLGVVSAVAISPNGKTLVYVAGPTLRAFDLASGDVLYETRMSAPTAALVFSPDSKRLAVTSRLQQARVYDAADGKELYGLGEAAANRVLGGGVVFAGALPMNPEVRTLAFSPDGKSIATATGGTLRLWAAADGKEKSLSSGHTAALVAVVVSPDGKTAVTYAADRMVCRWDAATGKLLDSFRVPADSAAVALSPDGKTAARSGSDGTIRIHETAGGKELHQFKGAVRGGSALVYSPDGAVLAERGADGVIRLYDPVKGAELRPLAAQAANPQGEYVVVAAAQVRSFGGVGSGSGLVFSPDGKMLASSGSASPAVMVAAPAAGRPARPTGPAISLHDVATGKLIRKIEPTIGTVSFTFSPDGRVLGTENADGSVSLFEVASGKERARFGGQNAPPAAVQGVPGLPGVVAVGGGGFPVGVGQPASPATVTFSPDGRMLVVRGADRSVRAWEVDGGKEVGRFQGHDGRIETVAISADGKCVATGSSDTTVLLWDAAALRKDMPERVAAELPDGMADTLWADLAGEDAGKALKAVLGLSGDPKHAVPVLAERLKPAAPIDAKQLEQWMADLESDKFAVRQEASANLVKAGEQVVPALKKVLASQPTIETRKRVEGLLDKLTGGVLTTEQLRLVRAIEALERMGTAEAREVLRALAGGAAGALPTREARAALDRLKS
jgi:WD40 repeat protein/beta-lactamase regulating signal transducer with metallopeptidase domain